MEVTLSKDAQSKHRMCLLGSSRDVSHGMRFGVSQGINIRARMPTTSPSPSISFYFNLILLIRLFLHRQAVNVIE
ncbi:MAG TPA: hypothetical protein QF353_05945 [Gammaproteobacteria bacterium]|nr:hypothetical protein [Gammaproteobacteria bacterium]